MSDQNNDFKELNEMLDGLGRAFEEFKRENDAALELKASGDSYSEVEEKVQRINGVLGTLEKQIRDKENLFEAQRSRIENLEALIATGGDTGNAKLAENHRDAFYKFLESGNPHSFEKLKEVEKKYRNALPEEKQVNLGSAAAGEALVPEIIRSAIEAMEMKLSPVRRLIPVIPVTSTDFKQVVDIGGTGSGWVAELDARSVTATPTLRTRTPTWGELYARPQASEWAAMDIPNAEDWLASGVAREFVSAEGIAVISGDGSNKPTGFLNTTPVATADDASPLRSAEALQFVAAPSPDDITEHVLALVYALQTAYRQMGRFALNSATLGLVRRAKTSDGHYLWEPNYQSGEPARIAGFTFEVWEDMPDAGLSPAQYPIAFGDWARGYLLAQRNDIRVLFDPYTTIGLISWWFRRREGGIILNNDAIKVAAR
jgi:HK97 family phage major capsid protein